MAKYLKNVNGNTYSVLEPNFLAARKTGQVRAQLPLDATNFATIPAENGMFLVYDSGAGSVKLPTNANTKGTMLHFSVEKEYDRLRPGLNTFAIWRGEMPYPRLYQPHLGDTFTTDAVKLHATTATIELFNALTVGNKYGIGADGFVDATTDGAAAEGVIVELIAKTTLPDGGSACKFKVVQVA